MAEWELTQEDYAKLPFTYTGNKQPDEEGFNSFVILQKQDIARAAQAKLVNWQMQPCEDEKHGDLGTGMLRLVCPQCWQELRRELEVGNG